MTNERLEPVTTYVNSQYLVETDWLEDHLNDPDLRIIDATLTLVPDAKKTYRIQSELSAWEAAHIPGSCYVDLQQQLSKNDSVLRFTFPDSQQFAETVSRLGVADDSRVVIYSTSSYMWATRLWFMFRAFGFANVAILNGGWQKWQAEERPVSISPCSYPAGKFTAHLQAEKIADKSQVLGAIEEGDYCILNALSRKQYVGEGAHYGRPGRITGSHSAPAAEFISAVDGRLLSAPELEAVLKPTGALTAGKLIAYCGGGIAATGTLFALALLGHEQHTALYDASMSEWANDPDAPMAQG